MVEGLDEKAIHKVRGPSWAPLRGVFFDVAQTLLSVCPEATSKLTTLYVKFCTQIPKSKVYAVVWLKTSKQIVIGLSLPAELESPHLGPPPQGTAYKGLTKYLTIPAGNEIPKEFAEWAKLAVSAVANQED